MRLNVYCVTLPCRARACVYGCGCCADWIVQGGDPTGTGQGIVCVCVCVCVSE